jgi:hypothetical protein
MSRSKSFDNFKDFGVGLKEVFELLKLHSGKWHCPNPLKKKAGSGKSGSKISLDWN